jgi:hypothetical protein
MSFFSRLFSVSTSKNREFWFSHAIILAATIIAVYLAASAGLKSAVQFELIKSDRDSYYMRSALLEELKDNLDNIESWGKEYRSGKAGEFIGKPDDFKLDTYVWTSMKESPSTFEIPSEILTNIRRYYRNTDIALAKMTSKKSSSSTVVDTMLEQSKDIRANTLELLEANIKSLKTKLQKLDVPL